MKRRPRFWLIVPLALALALAPALTAAATVLHSAAAMDEHCPGCPADAGTGHDNCDAAYCPVASNHCGAASAPLAPGGVFHLSTITLAYAQMHGLAPDRLRSRLDFRIFRPPIA